MIDFELHNNNNNYNLKIISSLSKMRLHHHLFGVLLTFSRKPNIYLQ